MPTFEIRLILSLLGVMLAAWVLWDAIHKRQSMRKKSGVVGQERADTFFEEDESLVLPQLLVVGVVPRRLPNKTAVCGFPGANLLTSLKSLKLTFGQKKIFHKMQSGETEPVFSVASMKEPGSFDLSVMSTRVYSGVLFFMELRLAQNNSAAFEHLLTSARTLCNHLEGELVDPIGRPLTPSLLDELRNKAQSFDLESVD